LPENRLM